MWTTPDQAKQIAKQYLQDMGTGGFLIGQIISTSPLTVRINDKETLPASFFYVADSCLGLTVDLRHRHGNSEEQLLDNVELRAPLRAGDAVLLLCRPRVGEQTKFILLDRIQPYRENREVRAK